MAIEKTPAPVAGPDDFSGTTALLIGVFLDLVATGHHQGADAWLRSHSAFRSGVKHVELVVTPPSEEDSLELEEISEVLEASIGRYSGYPPSAPEAVLKFRLEPHVHHPASQRREQLLACARAALRRAPEADVESIETFVELIVKSELGVAKSATQEYELVGVDDLDADRDATMAAIDAAQAALHELRRYIPHSVNGRHPNNWSPAVQRLSVQSLVVSAESVRSRTPPLEGGALRVGIITSGGDAAPGDVLHKLRRDPRVEIRHEMVILSQGSLRRQMRRAFDSIRDTDPVAYIIGFGGGTTTRLDSILDALEEDLCIGPTPAYVGVGHANYTRRVGSSSVRWCLTPSAAVDLFRLEALELPLRRAAAYERAAVSIRDALGRASANEAAIARLRADLTAIRSDLETGRALHLQP